MLNGIKSPFYGFLSSVLHDCFVTSPHDVSKPPCCSCFSACVKIITTNQWLYHGIVCSWKWRNYAFKHISQLFSLSVLCCVFSCTMYIDFYQYVIWFFLVIGLLVILWSNINMIKDKTNKITHNINIWNLEKMAAISQKFSNTFLEWKLLHFGSNVPRDCSSFVGFCCIRLFWSIFFKVTAVAPDHYPSTSEVNMKGMGIWVILKFHKNYIDGLVQNCSNSIANAMVLLQSCVKPSICCNHKNEVLQSRVNFSWKVM